MNSLLNLGRCLDDISSENFRRQFLYNSVLSFEHRERITFNYRRDLEEPEHQSSHHHSASKGSKTKAQNSKPRHIAHQSGTNCLAIDPQTNRFLITGGADSTIRLWDLESLPVHEIPPEPYCHSPVFALTKANSTAHTHAVTALAVYPFDPAPTTLLSASYDKTLLLSQISSSGLDPVHKFPLDFTPHTFAVSTVPGTVPLVAIGTAHPAIRLLDLRSGHNTHSLPGHNGAIYSLSFSPSPSKPHLLISGGADGRILLFDIRRAKPAFASLDLDDAVGFTADSGTDPADSRPAHLHLNWNAQAHNGPVTGVTCTASGRQLISVGHDSRIRVWDLATGRNELVHFGPRIRNSRNGYLCPLVLPEGFGPVHKEMLLWANDDSRGEIFMSGIREGTTVKILRTKGIDRSNVRRSTAGVLGPSKVVTSKGRINHIVLRYGGEGRGPDGALEAYSAHGDGSVCVWAPKGEDGLDEADLDEDTAEGGKEGRSAKILDAEQAQKKRKRDLIGDLVQGLSKRPTTFS